MAPDIETFYTMVHEVERLNLELRRQCLAVRRGLQNVQRTGPIYAAHPLVTSPTSIQYLKDLIGQVGDQDLQEQATRLYFTCIGHFVRLDLLMMEDTLDQFLLRVRVPIHGGDLSILEMVPWLAHQSDFEARESLARQALPVLAKAGELKRGIWKGVLDILKDDFGFDGYIEYCKAKKGYDFTQRIGPWIGFLEATDAIYLDEVSKWVECSLEGAHPLPLSRYHLIHLLHRDPIPTDTSSDAIIRALHRTMESLGLDGPLGNGLFIDMEPREGKSPLSRCVPLRIPQEVYITVKPMGLLSDCEALLHEVGHGLHFAYTDASLAYPYRHLPRSFALTECFGFLLQGLAEEPSWLVDCLGLSPREAELLIKGKWIRRLCVIRRYIGKFIFENHFFTGGLDGVEAYKRFMRRATGFLYEPEGAILDVEEEFYCQDYLEAWAAEAQLRKFLKDQFGQRWFEHKEAGSILRQVWSRGEGWDLEDMLENLGLTPGDLSALTRHFSHHP